MKTRTAVNIGIIAGALLTLAGSVAAKRVLKKNVVDEIDSRIPSPLIPKQKHNNGDHSTDEKPTA